MGMGVVGTSGISQLGQAKLSDIAGERRLGNDDTNGSQSVLQIILTVDSAFADDPQNCRLPLGFHSDRYTSFPPTYVRKTSACELATSRSAGVSPLRGSLIRVQSAHFPGSRLPTSVSRLRARAPLMVQSSSC